MAAISSAESSIFPAAAFSLACCGVAGAAEHAGHAGLRGRPGNDQLPDRRPVPVGDRLELLQEAVDPLRRSPGRKRGLALRRSPGLYCRSGRSLPVNSPLASGE